MPLTLPNLDDRRYADLVEEARALIPTYAPEWTNYNPSDPGITLLELFSWLTEMLIYRQNRVTDANIRSFLKLLNGPTWQPSGPTPEALAKDIRTTVLALRRRERAVSSEDFEALALEAKLDPNDANTCVARVRCLSRCNFLIDFEPKWDGHISLIVVPKEDEKLDAVIKNVEAYLEPRRLLTTFVHVVGPQYVPVDIQTTVVPLPDIEEAVIAPQMVEALRTFLDPLMGGTDKTGWLFGRNVFLSEVYQLLDQLPGVDYVPSVELSSDDPARLIRNKQSELVGLTVKPYELVDARKITAYVELQQLLTTFLHVVGPRYVQVDMQITLFPSPTAASGSAWKKIAWNGVNAIREFLQSGRNILVAEIYQLLDPLSGVDHVQSVQLSSDDPTRLIKHNDELIGITIKTDESVNARMITVKVQPAYTISA